MKEITKIDPIQLAKIFGLIYLIIGLIVGILATILPITSMGMGMMGIAMGGVAIIVFPIIYGILGFLGGLVFALLYNLIAPRIGGIKIELK